MGLGSCRYMCVYEVLSMCPASRAAGMVEIAGLRVASGPGLRTLLNSSTCK